MVVCIFCNYGEFIYKVQLHRSKILFTFLVNFADQFSNIAGLAIFSGLEQPSL